MSAPAPTLDHPWRDALQHALAATLDNPSEPGLSAPSLSVLNVSLCGRDIEAELRFHAGHTYCCMEHGCYVAAYNPQWWRRLRRHLAEVSGRVPPPMSLAVRTAVEHGARFLPTGGFSIESRGCVIQHPPRPEPTPDSLSTY